MYPNTWMRILYLITSFPCYENEKVKFQEFGKSKYTTDVRMPGKLRVVYTSTCNM